MSWRQERENALAMNEERRFKEQNVKLSDVLENDRFKISSDLYAMVSAVESFRVNKYPKLKFLLLEYAKNLRSTVKVDF